MPKSTKYEAKVPDQNGLIHYTEEEHAVWSDLYEAQSPQVQRYCAQAYLRGLQAAELPTDRVPSAIDISERLQDITGWRVEPVPALIGFKRFFSMLSEKTFPAASFIRLRRFFTCHRQGRCQCQQRRLLLVNPTVLVHH